MFVHPTWLPAAAQLAAQAAERGLDFLGQSFAQALSVLAPDASSRTPGDAGADPDGDPLSPNPATEVGALTPGGRALQADLQDQQLQERLSGLVDAVQAALQRNQVPLSGDVQLNWTSSGITIRAHQQDLPTQLEMILANEPAVEQRLAELARSLQSPPELQVLVRADGSADVGLPQR